MNLLADVLSVSHFTFDLEERLPSIGPEPGDSLNVDILPTTNAAEQVRLIDTYESREL